MDYSKPCNESPQDRSCPHIKESYCPLSHSRRSSDLDDDKPSSCRCCFSFSDCTFVAYHDLPQNTNCPYNLSTKYQPLLPSPNYQLQSYPDSHNLIQSQAGPTIHNELQIPINIPTILSPVVPCTSQRITRFPSTLKNPSDESYQGGHPTGS